MTLFNIRARDAWTELHALQVKHGVELGPRDEVIYDHTDNLPVIGETQLVQWLCWKPTTGLFVWYRAGEGRLQGTWAQYEAWLAEQHE